MAGRFTDLPYETFEAGQENKETLRKTLSHINLVREFLQGSGETRPIEEIPPQELDGYLASFFVNVRTRSGSDYEPSTLRGMLGSIERHLRRRDYGQSVISNADFPKTKGALTAKQKELKSMGKGSKPKASTALSAKDIDTLYDTNQLGLLMCIALQS